MLSASPSSHLPPLPFPPLPFPPLPSPSLPLSSRYSLLPPALLISSLKSASVRWAGWATVTYGRVGKLKTRVGKRKKIFGAWRRILPTLAWNPAGAPLMASAKSRSDWMRWAQFKCHIDIIGHFRYESFQVIAPSLAKSTQQSLSGK